MIQYNTDASNNIMEFSQSSFLQYIGLRAFSLAISHMMIVRIHVLYLIIIIKLEVWPLCYCLGLGHETMVCVVWLFIFLWKKLLCMYYIITASNGTQRSSNEIVSLQHKSINTSLFFTILYASFTQATWPDFYSPTNCNANFPSSPLKTLSGHEQLPQMKAVQQG